MLIKMKWITSIIKGTGGRDYFIITRYTHYSQNGRVLCENRIRLDVNVYLWIPLQFSLIAQSYLTHGDPMDCNMPGIPVITNSWSLLMSIKLVMPSNHFILCHPLLLLPSIFPASGFFQMSQYFASGGQSTRAPASISGLPMKIQDWFPLGGTGWISLQSKGPSRVFFNTTVQKHQFFSAQLSL